MKQVYLGESIKRMSQTSISRNLIPCGIRYTPGSEELVHVCSCPAGWLWRNPDAADETVSRPLESPVVRGDELQQRRAGIIVDAHLVVVHELLDLKRILAPVVANLLVVELGVQLLDRGIMVDHELCLKVVPLALLRQSGDDAEESVTLPNIGIALGLLRLRLVHRVGEDPVVARAALHRNDHVLPALKPVCLVALAPHIGRLRQGATHIRTGILISGLEVQTITDIERHRVRVNLAGC